MRKREINAFIKEVDEFHGSLRENDTVRELLALQAEGKFTDTSIDIDSYNGFLKFLSHPEVEKLLPKIVRVLDVGAYLNLFSHFLKELKTATGKCFECTGLEIKPEHCLLSNRIFNDNDIMCGDAAEMTGLLNGKFDIIIFCNFFHYENPVPESSALNILKAADFLLSPGGIMAVRSPDEKKIHSNKFFLPVESRRLTPSSFMPENYKYSDMVLYDCWFVARKGRS